MYAEEIVRLINDGPHGDELQAFLESLAEHVVLETSAEDEMLNALDADALRILEGS